MPANFPSFSSPEGKGVVRRLIKQKIRLDPHDFQLECVCKLLDGVDVFAITATGDGKSGLFSMYISAAQGIGSDSTLCPAGNNMRFPPNPALLVICPTKSLEEEMADSIAKLGLTTVAINADTIHEARVKHLEDPWLAARARASLIFLAPEQLNTKPFWVTLEDPVFQKRVLGMALDEAHLILTWGAKFRKAFAEIGLVRARMHSSITLLATTATMKPGAPFKAVCRSLGLHNGDFFLLRRSNMRHNIVLAIRKLHSGIAGTSFPEFLPILEEKRKALIFCTTISLSMCIMTYLWHSLSGPSTDRATHLRMYNSLNWPSYNREIRALMDQPESSGLITIATDTLSIGFDRRDIEDVYIVGLPEDADDVVQKKGRTGRDWKIVKHARGILYVNQKSLDLAKKVADAADNGSIASHSHEKKAPGMDLSLARYLTATCLTTALDTIYDNPPSNLPCSCESCTANPKPTRPQHCSCSRCVPEDRPAMPMPPRLSNPIPKSKRLTKVMRAHAMERFMMFRQDIWREADESATGMLPVYAFFPDNLMSTLLDHFALVDTSDQLVAFLVPYPLLLPHASGLWNLLQELKIKLPTLRKSRTKKATAVGPIDGEEAALESMDVDADGGTSSALPQGNHEPARNGEASGIRFRINAS